MQLILIYMGGIFIINLLQFTLVSLSPTRHCSRPISTNELRISNRCPYKVWPGIVSYSESKLLENGGFELQPFSTEVFKIVGPWSGKVWGRTGCQYSQDGCTFTCETGDCGRGLCCGNSSGTGPATIAEISFGSEGVRYGENDDNINLDRYSVSLVQGYNLQIQIRPIEGGYTKKSNKKLDCNLVGCFKDMNTVCPSEINFRSRRKGIIIGCQNPCLNFKEDVNQTKISRAYESCLSKNISLEFYTIVQEACPNVLVYDKQVCEGVVYTCEKNENGFSAYEIAFCP